MIDFVESKSRQILKTSHYSHNYTKFSVVSVGQPSRTVPSSRERRQIKKSRNPKRDPAKIHVRKKKLIYVRFFGLSMLAQQYL
jgi:hypothetical protein